jgi:hypothetical protein
VTARDKWAASGLVAFRLPSGFIVSGVWPSFSDLTRRGVVPWALRRAVIENYGKKTEDLSEEDIQKNVEQRLRIASSFLRGLYDDETGEWEQLQVTFEELIGGTFPGEDIETLDSFVVNASDSSPEQAALFVNATSEYILGLVDDKPKEEAGDVDALVEFRDEQRGGDGEPVGEDVAPTPIDAARAKRPKAGVPRRRRPRAAPEPREAAG